MQVTARLQNQVCLASVANRLSKGSVKTGHSDTTPKKYRSLLSALKHSISTMAVISRFEAASHQRRLKILLLALTISKTCR